MHEAWSGRGGWSLTRDDDRLTLTVGDETEVFEGVDAGRLTVRRTWNGLALHVTGEHPRRLPGLTRTDADAIRAAVTRIVTRGALAAPLAQAVETHAALERLLARHVRAQRWVPYDTVAALLDSLPTRDDALAGVPADARTHLETHLSPGELRALAFLDGAPLARVGQANAEIMRRELAAGRSFFTRVEKAPLTLEQARAVVTLDNRVRVIAAAGSGKTSVMVARAAYAIRRGFVRPERILMLAFNSDAARELQERVDMRLAALGLPSEGVRASTFHAFGLALIGEATGRRPRIAPWIEAGTEVEKVQEIVDELRDSSLDFRFKWDLFRLLYGKVQPGGAEPDSHDSLTGVTGFETYRGETVRTEGERLVADWLFLHGVDYRYEAPYVHDLFDRDHERYRPTFHYPDADLWHEHWALRADGAAPPGVVGYRETMKWKRGIHRKHGTALVETAWHEIEDHSGFEALARSLEEHGIALDWNPDRPLPAAEPLEHERLAHLVRTFMTHVKSGALTPEDLEARAAAQPELDTPRTRLFLDLYWRIHERWQAALAEADAVDFDDMLLRAAELVEQEPSLARWDLVMVDEFQDTSRARARLTRALLVGDSKHLLAVGDDWQAINRFAGADLTVMTGFGDLFGPALTRRLQTTFRTTQTTADVASRFVSANPTQIAKGVRAFRGPGGAPVAIVRVPRHDALAGAVRTHLERLSEAGEAGTVDVLGRYGFDRKLVPARRFDGLDVRFRTIHRSKGLEADHVILPNVSSGRFGFPSTIPDDPVLRLAMSEDDGFRHSEERRLLYVALTRARRTVTLFTVAGRESPFVLELLEDADVELRSEDGQAVTEEVRVCPGCGEGTLVRREGRFGEFYGCSTFPRCTQTVKV
ncbi:UvrD-helicase domain-containing protein [Demequina soli]|uniref:UvrD-helicase domain-containing protein n=1 Tax=Demequina soli TaxID=1638987 RepID=UPI0007833F3F|nr:UvrD-helicase domain-containing protein [Demequina soli]